MTFSFECLVQVILKRPPTPTSHSIPSKRLWGGRKEPVETSVGREGRWEKGKPRKALRLREVDGLESDHRIKAKFLEGNSSAS